MGDIDRAALVEKMKRAMALANGVDPDDWGKMTEQVYHSAATAALAAHDAHMAECGMVSLPRDKLAAWELALAKMRSPRPE